MQQLGLWIGCLFVIQKELLSQSLMLLVVNVAMLEPVDLTQQVRSETLNLKVL